MPRRVEVDLVDAVAVAVVGDQSRLVALGPAPVLERLDAARDDPGLADGVAAPAAALALERLRSARSDSSRSIGCSGGGWLSTSRAGSVTSIVAI